MIGQLAHRSCAARRFGSRIGHRAAAREVLVERVRMLLQVAAMSAESAWPICDMHASMSPLIAFMQSIYAAPGQPRVPRDVGRHPRSVNSAWKDPMLAGARVFGSNWYWGVGRPSGTVARKVATCDW